MPITIKEIIDVHTTYGSCKELIYNQDRSTSRLVESEDGGLRRVRADDEENLHIVIPEVLRQKLPNRTLAELPRSLIGGHHCRTAAHPGLKRFYARSKTDSIDEIWLRTSRRRSRSAHLAQVTECN